MEGSSSIPLEIPVTTMKKSTFLLLLSGLLLATTGGLRAAINVTAPSGGETFAPGDRIDVAWEVNGDLIGPGVISLRNEDNPRLFYIIKQNVRLRPATTEECLVPADIPEGRYRAVIRWGLLRTNSAHSPVIHIGAMSGGDGAPGDDPADDWEEEPGGLPDLVIANFEMTPARPVPGEAVEVRFRVRNRGETRSDACQVSWTPAERNPTIPTVRTSLPPMIPGGDRLIRFNLRGLPTPAPRLTSVVMVDSENAVTESDEANNILRTEITVAATDGGFDERGEPAGQPDLVITDFSLNPRTPDAREDVRVSFTVQNRGNQPSAPCAALWRPVEGHPIIPAVRRPIPTLEPGARRTIQFTFSGYLLPFPDLVTKVSADSERTIAESDEDNNSRSLRFSVRP